MPIYEYRCEKCGKVFEILQRFSDAPLKVHEDCGGEVEKLISHSAFQLKGSGWYQTDYAKSSSVPPVAKGEGKQESGSSESQSSDGKSSDGKSSEGKTDGSSNSKSESKNDSKSESKGENKTESKPAVTTSKAD
jgi:putative FmdB family regulatory protein